MAMSAQALKPQQEQESTNVLRAAAPATGVQSVAAAAVKFESGASTDSCPSVSGTSTD